MVGVEFLAIAKPAFILLAIAPFIVCGVLIGKNKDSGLVVGFLGVSCFFASLDTVLYGSITSVMINGVEMSTQLTTFSFTISAVLIFTGAVLIYRQLEMAAKKKATAELAAKKEKESGFNSVFRR